LVSDEIGELKPAAGAFECLLQTLGTEPHQTWYVGDNPHSDVAGASDVGMQAIWINWERQEYPGMLPAPWRTIRAFGELLELVPAAVRVS
jgi:putative hydrolase of the HAD superfamily